MAKPDEPSADASTPRPKGDSAREARLAAALRANLTRRKAATRANARGESHAPSCREDESQ